jgi:transcriptional regulator with XRE-family HTH domain
MRRELGAALATFREAAELTQSQLGRRVHVDHTTVAHLEKGRARGDEQLWRTLDEATSAAGVLVDRFGTIAAAYLAHQHTARNQVLNAARVRADALRRNHHDPGSRYQTGLVTAEPGTQDLGPDHGNDLELVVGASLAAWNPRTPANQSYVDMVRATTQELIKLDNQWGSIDVAGLANRVFRVVQHRITSGGYLSSVERDFHAAGAELAEVAGWIAFDAEDQNLARELNHEALHLARLAGDRDIEHLILLNSSMQAGHLHRNRESFLIAQTVIDDDRITPRVRAMSLVRQARAYSRTSNRADALRAFDHARSLFLDGVTDRDPAWAWWIDAHEIEGHTGTAHTELGDHRRGIPMLYNVVSATNKSTPRYRIVFAARLLGDLITVAAWRDAQHIAETLAGHTINIGSARAIKILNNTATKIERQPGVPPTLRDTVHHITQNTAR